MPAAVAAGASAGTAARRAVAAAAAAVVHLTGDDEAEHLIDLRQQIGESSLRIVHGLDGGHLHKFGLHIAQTIGRSGNGSLIGIRRLHHLLNGLLQFVELIYLGLCKFVLVESSFGFLHLDVFF